MQITSRMTHEVPPSPTPSFFLAKSLLELHRHYLLWSLKKTIKLGNQKVNALKKYCMVSGPRDLEMDFLSPFPFLSWSNRAPHPLQPGPLSNLSLRAANPSPQLKGWKSCFSSSPFWVFSFESNYLLSRDLKREITKRQSSFLSIPLPYQDKLAISPHCNASGSSFSPQLSSPPAGLWQTSADFQTLHPPWLRGVGTKV